MHTQTCAPCPRSHTKDLLGIILTEAGPRCSFKQKRVIIEGTKMTLKCDLEMRPRFSWFLHRISAGIGRLHHISHNTLHTAAAVFNLSQVDALDLKALKVHLLMCEAEPCLKCSHTEWRISRRSLCGSRSVRLIDCSGCSQHQHET